VPILRKTTSVVDQIDAPKVECNIWNPFSVPGATNDDLMPGSRGAANGLSDIADYMKQNGKSTITVEYPLDSREWPDQTLLLQFSVVWVPSGKDKSFKLDTPVAVDPNGCDTCRFRRNATFTPSFGKLS
jgi:hypothetical protein